MCVFWTLRAPIIRTLALDRVGARPGGGPVLQIGTGAIAAVLAAAGILALRG